MGGLPEPLAGGVQSPGQHKLGVGCAVEFGHRLLGLAERTIEIRALDQRRGSARGSEAWTREQPDDEADRQVEPAIGVLDPIQGCSA
jgi:hypothetical protein